jgi:hypothetical protein
VRRAFVVESISQLARADNADPTLANLTLILIGLVVVGVVALLAFLPLRLVRARAHRHLEVITTLMIFWAVATAGIVIKGFMDQQKWSAEHQAQILSGYFDPSDQTGAPQWPVKTSIVLGVAYCGLVIWSLGAKRR